MIRRRQSRDSRYLGVKETHRFLPLQGQSRRYGRGSEEERRCKGLVNRKAHHQRENVQKKKRFRVSSRTIPCSCETAVRSVSSIRAHLCVRRSREENIDNMINDKVNHPFAGVKTGRAKKAGHESTKRIQRGIKLHVKLGSNSSTGASEHVFSNFLVAFRQDSIGFWHGM